MQFFFVNANIETKNKAVKSPQGGLQQIKVCSNPLDRGEGERIYILTRFRKESKDLTV